MTLVVNLTLMLGLSSPLHKAPPPPPPPAPAVAVAPVKSFAVSANTPVQATPPAPAPLPPAQEGPQPVGPTQVLNYPGCTAQWTVTQTDPVTGVVGTFPGTYQGSCATANALAALYPGATVTQETFTTTITPGTATIP
jgi:hypothetical protein